MNTPLVVVSQRSPLSFSINRHGMLRSQAASGGLASALGAIAQKRPVHWIAAAMSDGDRLAARRSAAWPMGPGRVRLVDLPPEVQRQHYSAFANPLLWLVQHGLTNRLIAPRSTAAIHHAWEQGYQPANRLLARAAAAVGGQPVFLVQDYHLYLCPRLLRRWRPGSRVALYVHIPWPHPDAWSAMPESIMLALLDGMLGAHLVGFQSAADCDRFRATCRAYRSDALSDGESVLLGDGSRVLVRPYPITVDAGQVRALAGSNEAQAQREAHGAPPGVKTIVRVDRLDPSKNVAAGFHAFGLLLERQPGLRERVRFVAQLVPSRTKLPEYQAARGEALAAAAEVNARFGTPDWTPIQIIYADNRALALGLLGDYDVLLVNSLADGMNLVAKEGAVLNERGGVLVLSRETGVWDELGQWAIGVDPTDIAGTAQALDRALSLPEDERYWRAQAMRRAVESTSLDGWLEDQLRDVGTSVRPESTPAAATIHARTVVQPVARHAPAAGEYAVAAGQYQA
ncbi:MAG: alpha,alpha-trehalose-phosphate synthase (UDP-forming) [Chloroflexota bacterium]